MRVGASRFFFIHSSAPLLHVAIKYSKFEHLDTETLVEILLSPYQ